MLPLEGIKVLDFSIAIMAPMGTMMLGDMGAEIIKVEVTDEPHFPLLGES